MMFDVAIIVPRVRNQLFFPKKVSAI